MAVVSTTSTQAQDPPVNQGILLANLGLLPAGQTVVVTMVATPGSSDVGTLTTASRSRKMPTRTPRTRSRSSRWTSPHRPTWPWSSPPAIRPRWPRSTGLIPCRSRTPVRRRPRASSRRSPCPRASRSSRVPRARESRPPGRAASSWSGWGRSLGRLGHRHARHRPVTRRSRVGRSRSPRGRRRPEYDPDPPNDQASLDLAVAPSVTTSPCPVLHAVGRPERTGHHVHRLGHQSGPTPATDVLVAFPPGRAAWPSAFLGSRPRNYPALVSGRSSPPGQLAPGAPATVSARGSRGDPGTLRCRRRSRRPSTTSTSRRPRPARRPRSLESPGYSSSAREL